MVEREYKLQLTVRIISQDKLKNKDVRDQLSQQVMFPNKVTIEGETHEIAFLDVEETPTNGN